MTAPPVDRVVQYLIAFGVLVITGLAYAHCYVTLQALAVAHGVPAGPQAATWPLVLDVFSLLAGLAAWDGHRRHAACAYEVSLTVLYAAAVLAGTLAGAPQDPVSYAVWGAPAVTMGFGFHLLLRSTRLPEVQAGRNRLPREVKPKSKPTSEPVSIPPKTPVSTSEPSIRERLRVLFQAEPNLSNAEAGRRLGVSGQYVGKIRNQEVAA